MGTHAEYQGCYQRRGAYVWKENLQKCWTGIKVSPMYLGDSCMRETLGLVGSVEHPKDDSSDEVSGTARARCLDGIGLSDMQARLPGQAIL